MITKLYENRLRRDIFRLSIITLVTVLIWIGIATFRTLSKEQIKPNVKKQIIPLTATIDLDTMENIKKRRQIPDVAWENIKPELPESLVILETPEATSSSESTPESNLGSDLETETATESASE